MEMTRDSLKGKWMFWVKAAAVIGYFLGTMFFSRWEIFVVINTTSEFQTEILIENMIATALFFYGLTWLYRWVVSGQISGWGKKSVLVVVCGIGLRMLVNLLMIRVYQGDFNLYRMYGVAFGFLINLSLAGTVLLLFFIIDGRTWEKTFSDARKKWVGRISLAVFLVCTAVVVVNMCINTPIEGIEMLATDGEYVRWTLTNSIMPYKETILTNLNYDIGLGMVVSLFLLLWVWTKPKKEI